MPEQRAGLVGPDGITPLNREQRRALEKAKVEPDEFINIREWMKPEHKKKQVTRGEFMAILVHYHKQNRWRNRLKVALLENRVVRWFLKALFGMKIEATGSLTDQPAEVTE